MSSTVYNWCNEPWDSLLGLNFFFTTFFEQDNQLLADLYMVLKLYCTREKKKDFSVDNPFRIILTDLLTNAWLDERDIA